AVAKRIQPVAGFALVGAEGASEERTGEQVYASTCSACHTAGVAGAPKLGDSAAWKPLIAKGYEELLKNAINGINAMPPRGGNPNLTDLEVARAVVHITNQSGGDFPEPSAEGGDAAAGEAAPEGQAAAAADAGAQAQATAPAGAAAASDAAAQAPAANGAAQAPAGDAAQAQATALQAAQAQ